MTLGSPWLLALSLAGAVVLLAYLWWLRRGKRSAATFSSLGLLRDAASGQRPWRRHVPVVLLCAALVVLGVGAARPTIVMTVPSKDATVILALDVSGSMCSTDVTPNRLAAAQTAVRDFLQAQKSSGTKFGLVIFSGQAQLAVAPTTDTAQLLAAINGMTTGRGTVIGAAILTAVDAIAEIDPKVTPTDASAAANIPSTTTVTPAPPVPEIVVLLTDGANTRGVTPQQAAVQAAQRGVRVYPIGFGTTSPQRMACTAAQVVNRGFGGTGGFGGGGGGGGFGGGAGGAGPLVADNATLKAVAQITGGEFFSAASSEQLNTVLDGVRSRLGTVTEEVDISAFPAVLGSLLLLGAALVTLRRNPLG